MYSNKGNFLTDEKEIAKYWAEHLSNVLKMDLDVDEELISNLPQRTVIGERSVVPSNAEMKKSHKATHKWKVVREQ